MGGPRFLLKQAQTEGPGLEPFDDHGVGCAAPFTDRL